MTRQASDIQQIDFGTTANGDKVTQFICTNAHGLVMTMIDYGATMTSLEVPDRDGKLANVLLTCDGIAGFQECSAYFGSTVGRYCNRIAGGQFSIDGERYQLATNDGPNHLHGGEIGFDQMVWRGEPLQGDDFVGVRFRYTSPDGEEGYPGTLVVTAEYLLNNRNELIIDFRATTDQATHVNLTNHNYWNLGGHDSGTILDHQLRVEADHYLPTDETLIPTGEVAEVAGTLFDFREFRAMGDRIDQVGFDPPGFDFCYALRNRDGSLALAATVQHRASGRLMEIWTTQPGLQFYSGNFLDGSAGGCGYQQYSGFCLETQHYPDTPNQDEFPSTLLRPGEQYHHRTVHKFDVLEQ